MSGASESSTEAQQRKLAKLGLVCLARPQRKAAEPRQAFSSFKAIRRDDSCVAAAAIANKLATAASFANFGSGGHRLARQAGLGLYSRNKKGKSYDDSTWKKEVTTFGLELLFFSYISYTT